jgi:hypothetical protein
MSHLSQDFYRRGSGHIAAVRMSVVVFVSFVGFAAALCVLG